VVARKRLALKDRHVEALPGQESRRGAAGGASADYHHVVSPAATHTVAAAIAA